ncbi:MAG: hypothetical protein KJO07_21150 [Deltaproteobacteria bacterium]|nr:hypothetical protein [Deltaproteobacteria bacterium]
MLRTSRMYIIDQDVSPDGDPIELTYENGHYTVWVAGEALMSSEMYGSERKMAALAANHVGQRDAAKVLVGGLGLGHTLRAALDHFGRNAGIMVAELLPVIVRHHYGVLENLAGAPLRDQRVTLFEGDVLCAVSLDQWDAILLDVDNGPLAFTVASNAELYTDSGVRRFYDALTPGGILVLWSASRCRGFLKFVKRLGLPIRSVRTPSGGPEKKVKHTLFVIEKPD